MKTIQPEVLHPMRSEMNNDRSPNSIPIDRKGTAVIGQFSNSYTDLPPKEFGYTNDGECSFPGSLMLLGYNNF
jgi:hypothetical protein